MDSSRLRNSLIGEVSLMSSFVELLVEERAAKNKIKTVTGRPVTV